MASGLVFIAIGSGLLGIKPELSGFLPTNLDSVAITKVASWGGVLAILVGFALIAFVVLVLILSRKPIRRGEWHYSHEIIEEAGFPELFIENTRVFGGDIASIGEVLNWWKKNPKIAWKVIRVNNMREEESIGFFELLPITSSAVKKIEGGKIDGRQMEIGDISPKGNKPAAYYVGSILSKYQTRNARFSTMFEFLLRLKRINKSSEVILYARPVTENGLRLVKDYNFQKLFPRLSDQQSVWKVVIPQGSDFTQLDHIYRKILKREGGLFAFLSSCV